MAVERVEQYTTLAGDKILKVILKPTKTFPVGYFYTDDNEITRGLLENYNWCLGKNGKNAYITTRVYGQILLKFHQEYAKRVLDYNPEYLDHIDGIGINNLEENLNVVTSQQNQRNRPSKGYTIGYKNCFQPYYVLDRKTYPGGTYHTEPEALLATYQLRQEVYSDYNYNFYLDRRNDIDLVDLELTGKITSQQAIYLHTRRLVESNPWYAYRYNLFDYCRQNNIIAPNFNLDSQGFMINPYTGTRLCPY